MNILLFGVAERCWRVMVGQTEEFAASINLKLWVNCKKKMFDEYLAAVAAKVKSAHLDVYTTGGPPLINTNDLDGDAPIFAD